MGSAADRIRARLGSIKSRRVGGTYDKSNSNGDRSGRSGLPVLHGADYLSRIANLKLAITLNIQGRKYCYPNYHTTGFAVCDALVETGDSTFTRYCLEPYPDICQCGRVLGQFVEGTLRTHCNDCRGDIHNRLIDSYFIQRIALHLEIHQSWVEYAAAWALYSITCHNLGKGTRYDPS